MRLCKWCRQRPAKKSLLSCRACNRQRGRKPHCSRCDGPTFGERSFCPDCSPREPPRSPRAIEIMCVLIDPIGNERTVYRGRRESIPGCGSTLKGGGTRTPQWSVSRFTPRILVLDVSRQCWTKARVGV